MEASKSKICGVGQQLGEPQGPMFHFQSEASLLLNQEEPTLQVKPKGSLLENSVLFVGGWIFCSRQAFDGLDEAHPHEGGQSALHKLHQFKRCHPAKHPHRNTSSNICPNIWTPCDPASLTHKNNHHRTIQD